MQVSDVAREDVVAAYPDATATELASKMAVEEVGSIVIVEGEPRAPVGLVTDRDLAIEVVAEDHPGSEVLARELADSEIVTIDEDADLLQATRRFRRETVRRLVVVNDDGHLVGILSMDDVYHVLVDEQRHLDEVVRAESPPR